MCKKEKEDLKHLLKCEGMYNEMSNDDKGMLDGWREVEGEKRSGITMFGVNGQPE